MSLKQLEQAIKNLKEDSVKEANLWKDKRVLLQNVLIGVEKIEVEFAEFKKQVVCIPKNKFEEENDKAKKYLSEQKAKIGFNVTSNLGFWEGYLKCGKELLASGIVSEESK